MSLPNFKKIQISEKRDSIASIDSGTSSMTSSMTLGNSSMISSILSEKTSSIRSDFAENWADNTKMEEFLWKAGHYSFQENSFENNVNQVTADWTDIYMVTSFKGIGSDASRWVCVKTGDGRFVYQRRPSKRKAKEENATFYRSIVLNVDGDIIEVV